MAESMKDYEEMIREDNLDLPIWNYLTKVMEDREVLNLKVDGIVPKGLICNVEGQRAFMPNGEISTKRVENPASLLGKDITAYIIRVDRKKNSIVLSHKAILIEEERKEKNRRISAIRPGDVVSGVVEELRDFGAFIKIADGITGLLHVSEISTKRISYPKEVLSLGDKIECQVIGNKDGKIALSRKILILEKEEKEEREARKNLGEVGEIGTCIGDILKGLNLDL